MFNYPKFAVPLSQNMQVADLGWPEPGEALDESNLGCNREYIDLRRLSWKDAKDVLVEEAQLVAQIEGAGDGDVDSTIEEQYDGLYGLDIGVASTVIGLSAARCVPFSSCNAGAFGGRHHEMYPVVAFYAKVGTANLLLAIATEIGMGIRNGEYGCLVLFSDDIRKFPIFAEAMIGRRKEFNALRLSATRRPKPSVEPEQSAQYELPF